MSTGMAVFDKTMQTTNLWLDDLCETGRGRKLRHALPESLRELWPADGQDWSAPDDRGTCGYGYGPPPRRVCGYDDDWYE